MASRVHKDGARHTSVRETDTTNGRERGKLRVRSPARCGQRRNSILVRLIFIRPRLVPRRHACSISNRETAQAYARVWKDDALGAIEMRSSFSNRKDK